MSSYKRRDFARRAWAAALRPRSAMSGDRPCGDLLKFCLLLGCLVGWGKLHEFFFRGTFHPNYDKLSRIRWSLTDVTPVCQNRLLQTKVAKYWSVQWASPCSEWTIHWGVASPQTRFTTIWMLRNNIFILRIRSPKPWQIYKNSKKKKNHTHQPIKSSKLPSTHFFKNSRTY